VTRDRARGGSRRVLPVLMLVTLLTGCSAADISPIPTPTRSLDGSPSPDQSRSTAKGKWTGLDAKCPTLESSTARALGVAGEGRPTSRYLAKGQFFTADCRWGSDDGHGLAVTVRMGISEYQAGTDAQWEILSAAYTGAGVQKLSGVGNEAFCTLEPVVLEPTDGERFDMAVAVRVRSYNAVATVRLMPPAATTADQLRRLRPAAAEITEDMLDDLR
jgi:hypothetical protein